MKTKLTLRMDDRLIRRAKAYARATERSVSQMVAEYFMLLGQDDDPEGEPDRTALPPKTHALVGILADAQLDEDDYRRHIEEKYL